MYLYCKISSIYAQDVKPVHEEGSIFNPNFFGWFTSASILETAER